MPKMILDTAHCWKGSSLRDAAEDAYSFIQSDGGWAVQIVLFQIRNLENLVRAIRLRIDSARTIEGQANDKPSYFGQVVGPVWSKSSVDCSFT